MSSVSLDIDVDVGILVGRYGYASVLKSLEENMRRTYEYLREYYGAGAGAGAGNQTNSVDISGNQTNSVGVSANSGNQKKTRNRKTKGVAVEPPGDLLKTEKVENSSGDQKPQPPPGSPETPIQHIASSIQEKLVEPEIPVNSSGDQKKVKVSGVGVGGGKGSGVKVSVVHVTEEVPQSEENVMVSGEEDKKKAWPFVKSENTNNEKKGNTPREILKEEILKRKMELNSSGLKKNAVMTKENLERLISEGLGYTEMGRRLGRMPSTVKEACLKHGLEPLRGVRKIIPESLKKYLDDDNCRKEKLSENREIASKLVADIDNSEWIDGTTLCIYGVFRKSDKTCVYIGATEDFTKRVQNHKKAYDSDGKHKLYDIMKENGGFENHIYIPLEKPENEIGLSFRESLWWESLKPLGNSVNPFFTV